MCVFSWHPNKYLLPSVPPLQIQQTLSRSQVQNDQTSRSDRDTDMVLFMLTIVGLILGQNGITFHRKGFDWLILATVHLQNLNNNNNNNNIASSLFSRGVDLATLIHLHRFTKLCILLSSLLSSILKSDGSDWSTLMLFNQLLKSEVTSDRQEYYFRTGKGC